MEESGSARPGRLWRLLLTVSFGTAVASLIYEISWIRMLSLVFGSATHSFELMLSAFILGLALGSLWVHRRADRFRSPMRALGIIQWSMGLAALATLPVYNASFEWMEALASTLQPSESGYRAFGLARYAFSLAVMLPASFLAGTTLPLITRILIGEGDGERSIGWVYGLNTLGSIAGVALGGLVLLPAIGLKALLLAGASLDTALGILLLARADAGRRRPRPALVAAVAIAAVALLAGWANEFDPLRLTAGVFRTGQLPIPGDRELVFYEDGRTATVAVIRATADRQLVLRTNGKPDASLPERWLVAPDSTVPPRPMAGDEATQVLLALVTLAHGPEAREAAVIGQGSGLSSHFLLGSPHLRQLTTIEIEPAMVDGSRAFYPANRRVFDDPRSRIVIDDAKAYFAGGGRRYDLILSEPSNPWVSGVASLFTSEFYSQIRNYLTDDGVFGQWLHLYELSDGLVLSVMAALHQNFPSYEVFLVGTTDLLIIASDRPTLPQPDWSVLAYPGVAADLRHTTPPRPEHMEAMRVATRDALDPLLNDWAEANSDFFPVLDLNAEETRFREIAATGFLSLARDRLDIIAPLFGGPRPFGAEARSPVSGQTRLEALALGAGLRAARAGRSVDDPGLTAALYVHDRFDALVKRAGPPPAWHAWLEDAVAVEQLIHAGTAGVADEVFYHALHRYADGQDAPERIGAALHFLHGLAAWDFPRAAAAADRLVEDARRGTFVLPASLLRDGVVLARLVTGDVAGARHAFDFLAGHDPRPVGHLRVRLLDAYIRTAERGALPPPAALRYARPSTSRTAPRAATLARRSE